MAVSGLVEVAVYLPPLPWLCLESRSPDGRSRDLECIGLDGIFFSLSTVH